MKSDNLSSVKHLKSITKISSQHASNALGLSDRGDNLEELSRRSLERSGNAFRLPATLNSDDCSSCMDD
eukprot:6209949-Pleurochrysis_carterae.AAC.2